ncbi:MAG: hypothetical protein ACK5D8_06580 [Bacteroidota bacterium]
MFLYSKVVRTFLASIAFLGIFLCGETQAATYFSQGTGLFSTTSNWNTATNGSGTSPVAADLTSGLHNFTVQAGHTVTIDLDPSMVALTLDGNLVVGNDATTRTVTITGLTTVNAGASFTSGTADISHAITFRGNLVNNGNIDFYNTLLSSVNATFNGTALTISGAGSFEFANLSLAATTTTVLTLNSELTINGAVTLPNGCTLNDGGNNHAVYGDWIETGNGALTGAGTITFASTTFQQIPNAATFNNIIVNGGATILLSGAITVNGDFTVNNSSSILAPTAVTHIFNRAFSIALPSTYTQTAGTTQFAGSSVAQTIPTLPCSYANVTLTNGGIALPKTIDGDLTLGGLLTVNASAQLTSTGSIFVTGTVSAGGIRMDGVCDCTGSFVFSGASGQTISSLSATPNLGTAAITSNLNPGVSLSFSLVSPTPASNWNINNDITINSGNLIVNNGVTLTGQSGFSLNMSGNSLLYVRGLNNFPTGFGAVNFTTSSTTVYDANLAQVIRGGINYSNLSISSNTKTIDGDLTVLGNFNMSGNMTANFLGFNVSVSGNFTNSAGSTFNNDQTVRLNAFNANQNISGTGTFNFRNLECTSDGTTAPRTKTFGNNITVNGDFSATNIGGTTTNTLIIEIQGFTITNDNTGSFNLGDNVVLNTSGLNTFRSSMLTFGTRNLALASTINYNASSPALTAVTQLISNDVVYGNLSLGGGGPFNYKAATGNLVVNGNFGRTGNFFFRDSSFSVTIGGNYLLRDVDYPSPSPSTVFTFNGDFQSLGSSTINQNLPNVVFAGTGIKLFNASPGYTVTVFGNLTIQDGVTVDANNKNLQIRGNFINAGTGIFTQTATTTLNGTNSPQTITTNAASNFGNVTINKISGVAANRTVTFNTITNILGSISLTTNNAILEMSGVTVNIGGNWTVNTGCSVNTTNSTLNFNGTASTQTINNGVATPFHELVISGSSTKSLAGQPLTINGDVNIDNCLFQGNSVAITAIGNWTCTGTFTHSSTVTFGGGNQSISGSTVSFNAFTAAGTGTKTMVNGVTVNSTFTINAGSTVDLTASNSPLNIGGGYTNNGSILTNNATVTFIGTSGRTINSGGTGIGKRFYNLVFNCPAIPPATTAPGCTFSTNPVEVLNDFLVYSASITANVNITVGGNHLVTNDPVNDLFGTYTAASASVLTLNAGSGSLTFNPGISPSQYSSVVINAPGATYTLGDNLRVANNQPLTITAGTFKFGGKSVTMANGNVVINGGTFHIDAGGQLFLANGANLTNNGGTLMLVGTPTSNAFVRRNGTTGGYVINQNAGTLHAKNYTIENTGTTGFTIGGTTVIDPVNNLSNGVFSSGTGTQYLNLTGYNFTSFITNNVRFNLSSSGPNVPGFNVSRTSGTGVITFNGSTGSMVGDAFDNDPGNTRVLWTSAAKRWTGAAGDNDWHTAGNWSPAVVPGTSDTVYIDHTTIPLSTAFTVNINSANAEAGRLILDRMSGTGNITLVIGAGRTLTVSENVDVLVGCTLTQTNNTSLLNIAGSFVNTGTFNNGSSTVNFNGAGGNANINAGTSPFFNLTISGTSIYSLSGAITVQNNLDLSNGTLDVTSSSFGITVQGNWNIGTNGVFVPRSGTLTFSGAGNQSISGGSFFNFVTSGGGTKTILSNVTINNITIGSGTTIDAGQNIIFVNGNWINNSATGFTQSTSGLVQFGGSSGTQQIDNGTNSTTFSNVLITGAAAKTVFRDFSTIGDFTIGAASGTVDFSTFQLTGTPSKIFSVTAVNTLIFRGASNFPSGFGTVTLNTACTVQYIVANGATIPTQTIFTTNYGNLILSTTAGLCTKVLTGNITIAGGLTISDVNTQLDASDRNLTLAGNLSFPAGGRVILWGTTGTFIHNGPGYNFDVDYTGFPVAFRNITLAGSGTKTMLANLNVAGDVVVQNGVSLTTGTFLMTGAGGNFNLQGGATLNCAVPSSAAPAFPQGFSTYALNQTSTVNLNGGTNPQTIFNVPTYGNLTLSNTSTSTIQSGASLNISGNLATNSSTLIDNGQNINFAGETMDIRLYTPSVGTTITMNGAAQNIADFSGEALNICNIVFANTGIKTIAANVNNIINISENVTINTGVTVNCTNRTINFSGAAWTNNGSFNHLNSCCNNIFNFVGTGAQNINPGASNIYQGIMNFNNTAGPVTFLNNGVNFHYNNGYLFPGVTIAVGAVVNMGNLTHTIRGSIFNDGTFNCSSASFIFNGGNQTFNMPGGFTFENLTVGGNGTKLMNSDWNVNNITINFGTTLSTSTSNFNLTCRGNWSSPGGFAANSSSVFFESPDASPKTIDLGTQQLRDVFFNSTFTNARTYTLLAANTIFNRQLTIGNGATISLNGNILTLGSNNAFVETHTVAAGATLSVNSNSTLRLNCDNGTSVLNVNGTLETIGNNLYPAKITRSTGTGRIQLNMLSGSLIKAQYYAYEYMSDAGMNIADGATVDNTNNLSDGTWSFINTAGGVPKYYLILNGTVTSPIQNVIFNFVGSPTVGVHFNVQRTTGTTVQFNELISGTLGNFQYESDGAGPASATTGFLRWPVTLNLVWTGAINRDWNIPGNWSPASVPTSVDNVQIPSVTNNPLINSSNATCKNLTITNGNLGLQNGYDLIVTGDIIIGTGSSNGVLAVIDPTSDITIQGSWTRGTNGTFVHGSGTVIFTGVSGTFSIAPLTSAFFNLNINGNNSTFHLTGSTVFIDGSLSVTNGTLAPVNAGYQYFIKGNYSNTAQFISTVSGTINFNGNSPQTITNGEFSNMTTSGTSTKTTVGNFIVINTLTLNTGSTLAASAASIWDLRGNVTMNVGSSYDDGGNLHQYKGTSWTGNGNCIANTGGIRFMRLGTQSIVGGKFNQLSFEVGGAKILSGNVTVNGDVNVLTATQYLNFQTFTMNCINPLATFSSEPSTFLYIRGANNGPTNFGAYDIDVTSNTYYDGALNQTIAGISYGNLILGGGVFTKTLGENTTVKGNLTINTTTLDCSPSNYTLLVGGNFNNNSNGSFIANQGEVILNGTSAAIQYVYIGGAGNKSFYNLTVNRLSGQLAQLNNGSPNIINNLKVISGTLDLNGNTATVGRSLENNGGSITTSGSFILTGTTGTGTIRLNGSALNDLTINAPGATYTAADNLAINGVFNLTAGTFNGNGNQVNLGINNQAVNINGTYITGAGGRIGLGNGVTLTVSSTGSLTVVGTAGNLARVTNNSSGGRYNFVVNGNISAQHYVFEFMNETGIQINSSATIDATNNFSNGTFTNGAANGTYFVINNSQTLTMESVAFSLNPGGTARNVSKTVNSGNITFNNFLGSFSGTGFENDPNGRINWTGPITLTWNGNSGTNWFNANNWTASAGPNIVPTGVEDVIIPLVTNQPVINQDGAVTNKLSITSGATLSINTPFASAPDLVINGDFFLNGNLVSTGAGDTIEVKGNWSKGGTGNLLPGASTVIFNAAGGTKNINNGTSIFNNLVVDGNAIFQLGSNTTLNGNLQIKQGSLDVTSTNFDISLGGNWLNQATFVPRGGTVNFTTSAASRTINNGASSFFNLTLNGTSSTIFDVVTNPLRTGGNTNIASGTLRMNNLTFFNGDNVGVDGFTINGTFDMGNNGQLLNGASSSIAVNNGGLFKAVGSSDNVLNNISRQSTGFYTFSVNAGGTIQAQYYQFSFLNASGLLIKPGAIIHATNRLTDGNFTNGAPGGTYLDIQNNFADFTIDSVLFESGPTYNVTRTFGTGVLTFKDSYGPLAGAPYENDDASPNTGLVRWTYTNPLLTWTGAADTEWANLANWKDVFGFPATFGPFDTVNVVIPNVSGASGNFPVIKTSSGPSSCGNITINSGATLTIQENQSLNINGSLANTGTLTVTSGSTSVITVTNTWSNTGTFNAGASTVVMTAASGFKSVGGGTGSFNNLTLNGGATFQTSTSLTIAGNFLISAGTFLVANPLHQVTIGGNWTSTGNFQNGSGVVLFNKNSGTQTITSSSSQPFHTLRMSNSGALNKVVSLASDISINGNLEILTARSSLNAGAFTVNIKGNWNNSGGLFVSTGTVVFNGTGSQSLYRSASVGETMNNLTINNTAGVQLLCNLVQTGNLTLTAGDLDVNLRTLTIGGDFNGSTSITATTGTINLSGANNFAGIFNKGTSTFVYRGSGSQTIRAIDYHNLSSENTGARIFPDGSTVNISGTFTPFTNTYTTTNSTINFNGTSAQTIPAFNYFNLSSSSTGNRTLASTGTIGIAGTFTPGTNTYSVTGSTVNFNGSAAQTIPAFQYFNLSSSSSGARTLSNTGNIRLSGSFTPGTNTYTTTGTTVEYNGSGASNQLAGGPFSYENLTINRTGTGVVRTSGVNRVRNTMTITSGTFNVNTGDSMIFVSTIAQTARLAPVASGSITGRITMERYAPRSTSGPGWVLLGSCVNDATINDWTNNFPTSGFPGATANTFPPFTSVYWYDETTTGVSNNGFTAPTDGSNTLVNGRGYWAYMSTGYLTTNDIKFDVTGTHTVGNKNFNISYTNSGGINEDGWNLIANPYPSNIDWDAAGWTKTNVANAVYIYNAATSSMASYVSGVATNGGSRYINSSQGFMVKATADSPSLIATENVKTANTAAFLRQAETSLDNESLLRLNLMTLGTNQSDEVVVRFNPGAITATVDDNLDAYDFLGTSSSINLYAIKAASALSIYSQATLDQSLMIPLRAKVQPNTAYAINFTGIAQLAAAYPAPFASDHLVIVDNQTGATYDLSNSNLYSFNTGSNDTLMDLTLRFSNPLITSLNAGVRDESQVAVFRDAGGFYAKFNFDRERSFNVSIANAMGQVVVPAGTYFGQTGKVYLPMINNLSEGMYFVNVQYGDRVMTAKIMR